MYPDLSKFSDNLTLTDTDLNQLNVKDPDTLYFQIKTNLQELIDIYYIASPSSKDIDKLNSILDTIYTLHENCTLDIQEDYE